MTLSILAFLGISFGYSLFEKLKDKKKYTLFLSYHLKNSKFSSFLWWFLVMLNSITTLTILLSIGSLLLDLNFFFTNFIYPICSCTILILLLGQRMAGDFQGAANLGIYMLLVILGWYISIH